MTITRRESARCLVGDLLSDNGMGPRDAFGIIGGLEHLKEMRSSFPLPVKAHMRELASLCR
jgi:hypothetical protein